MKGRTKNIKFKFYSKYLFVISFLVLAVFLAGCGGVLPPTNQSPIASFTANPTSGIAPLEVAFDASNSSDSDGNIISYAWDFKDGSTGSGQTITHTFSSTGSYNVELTVTDNDGLTGTDTMLLAAAGSCDCVASTMHIQSIIAGIIPASKNWKYGHVMVTVFDDCGNPVSAAGVTGTFTGDFTGTLSGTTGTDGIAIITTSVSVKKPSYEFCVEGVSHSSLTYDSSGNVETCRSK